MEGQDKMDEKVGTSYESFTGTKQEDVRMIEDGMARANKDQRPEGMEMEQDDKETATKSKPNGLEHRQQRAIVDSKAEPREERRESLPILLHHGVVKEVAPCEVIRSKKWLGAGSFGSCYLATYRGIRVAVKEFKELPSSTAGKLKQDVIYEATVISRLGDHPGLPLLFGVTTNKAPFRLIVQFHGDQGEGFTL